jgi:hypothetical protein
MKPWLYLGVGMFLGAGAVAAAGQMQLQDLDPVKVSPQYYKVLIDNDRVRVLEYRLKPGEKEGMHSHPPNGIVYSMATTKTRTTLPDGKITEGGSTAGTATWRAGVTTHGLENIGTTEMHNLAIDVKPCP